MTCVCLSNKQTNGAVTVKWKCCQIASKATLQLSGKAWNSESLQHYTVCFLLYLHYLHDVRHGALSVQWRRIYCAVFTHPDEARLNKHRHMHVEHTHTRTHTLTTYVEGDRMSEEQRLQSRTLNSGQKNKVLIMDKAAVRVDRQTDRQTFLCVLLGAAVSYFLLTELSPWQLSKLNLPWKMMKCSWKVWKKPIDREFLSNCCFQHQRWAFTLGHV